MRVGNYSSVVIWHCCLLHMYSLDHYHYVNHQDDLLKINSVYTKTEYTWYTVYRQPSLYSAWYNDKIRYNDDLKVTKKKVREKSRECHNHKPQPFPDTKRKRKPTNPNKHKSNKRTKSTKISSLFPKQGNCNTKRTEKHRNKMTHSKTYNKTPRRINHKATKSKTNTGTTALEWSVE